MEDEKWIEAIRAVLPVIEAAVRVYDEDYFHNLHHENAHDYNLRASNPESSSSECKVNMISNKGKIPLPHIKRKFLMLDLRTQISFVLQIGIAGRSPG